MASRSCCWLSAGSRLCAFARFQALCDRREARHIRPLPPRAQRHTGWHTGCRCTQCRAAHADTQRTLGRARAQARLPVELRQQLVDAIYAGQLFRSVLRDLNLTPNQVWGMARVDREWSAILEAALTATRRDDLKHGTNAAYVHGCLCGLILLSDETHLITWLPTLAQSPLVTPCCTVLTW